MKILFITLLDFSSFSERNIYCDLLREFIKNRHEVYCISPMEKRTNVPTYLDENGHLLKLKIGNVQKTNIIEKGISTFLLERQYVAAIKKYFSHVRFELVLYSTPPITLGKAVRFVKNRDGAKTYLLLKDIFPQNAVDLGMLSKHGAWAPVYWYFRHKEKKLYSISDKIGCMSQANVEYVVQNNPEIDSERVEICPNCIELMDMRADEKERTVLRQKYNIPLDKKVFVYGGNLGKPQGIPFIIDCLKQLMNQQEAFFLIVGDGTDYSKIATFFNDYNPKNMMLMKRMPKEDYDRMIAACDVGLIFLDHRFSIPNFPSRLLSYMQAGIPVLACTDPSTDIGRVIECGGFGWWCESNAPENFVRQINHILRIDCRPFSESSYHYLAKSYCVEEPYKRIISSYEMLINRTADC